MDIASKPVQVDPHVRRHAILSSTDASAPESTFRGFQSRVRGWIIDCLGSTRADDRAERVNRALEEALELAQACGCSEEDAVTLVRYVYSRPPGAVGQEVGGAILTIAALCEALGLDMGEAAEAELVGVRRRIEAIRSKAEASRPGSPLPR